jgi:cytochrome c oxidase subunit 1
MLFSLAVISAVGFGGFGGLFLGTMVSDIYFHETYFVVGHFHLMIGTVTLLGLFGALYFWYPKMFGRKMSERLGRWHFWLTAVPMMSIFLLMHLQGLGGMIRRTYDPGDYLYNEGMNSALRFPITTLAYILFIGQGFFFWNFFRSLKRGEVAGENPWEATTLEWTTPSPAPHGNWPGALPEVTCDPYEYIPGDGPDHRPQNEGAPA